MDASKIAKAAGISNEKIPKSYQIIGDVLLTKFAGIREEDKVKIANAFLAGLPYIKTVCEMKGIEGEFRKPIVSILAGNGTETIHTENKILYKIDMSKVMFSKGNLLERKRLLEKIKPGETVLDMFAGVGYFSIPIAKFTGAKVIAIEKNRETFGFLKSNIEINKVEVAAINDDCTNVTERADRIIMGYFPGTEKFLKHALSLANPGCVIHYHNVYGEKDFWEKPIEQIDTAARAMNKNYQIMAKKKVKSVGPRKYHVVVDFQV